MDSSLVDSKTPWNIKRTLENFNFKSGADHIGWDSMLPHETKEVQGLSPLAGLFT
jgi:hypothetical protein